MIIPQVWKNRLIMAEKTIHEDPEQEVKRAG
jgi:hypothetical protein